MSKKSIRKYLGKRTFDVDGKPELAKAILARLDCLDVILYPNLPGAPDRCIRTWEDGGACCYAHDSMTVFVNQKGYLQSTLSDLYDIPAKKHTISIDGGKPVELSQESYDNLKAVT